MKEKARRGTFSNKIFCLFNWCVIWSQIILLVSTACHIWPYFHIWNANSPFCNDKNFWGFILVFFLFMHANCQMSQKKLSVKWFMVSHHSVSMIWRFSFFLFEIDFLSYHWNDTQLHHTCDSRSHKWELIAQTENIREEEKLSCRNYLESHSTLNFVLCSRSSNFCVFFVRV